MIAVLLKLISAWEAAHGGCNSSLHMLQAGQYNEECPFQATQCIWEHLSAILSASICVQNQGTNETGQIQELPETFELSIF